MIFYFQVSSCFFFGYKCDRRYLCLPQNMANIWQIRGAPYGAQWRVPINFILCVFTSMLVLLSYHRFVPGLGPTFEKIAFNCRHVTLRTFRSLVGGILENS